MVEPASGAALFIQKKIAAILPVDLGMILLDFGIPEKTDGVSLIPAQGNFALLHEKFLPGGVTSNNPYMCPAISFLHLPEGEG